MRDANTAGPRPFRFGVCASTDVVTAQGLVAVARRAEELGYAAISVADHLAPRPAPLTALAAMAVATTRIRLQTLVLCNDFHHPAVLAQEMATLDDLSGGRIEIGLGAGWAKPEYDRAGIAFESPGVRVSRLEEAVQVLQRLCGGDPVLFEGHHYTLHGVQTPRSAQQPHPPVLIGGASPRILAVAGRHADIVSLLARSLENGWMDAADLRQEAALEKVARVRAAAGDRFASIELHKVLWIVDITSSPRVSARRELHRVQAGGGFFRATDPLTEDDLLASADYAFGTVPEIVTALRERRERIGISMYSVLTPAMEAFAPVVAHLAGT